MLTVSLACRTVRRGSVAGLELVQLGANSILRPTRITLAFSTRRK